MDTPCIHHIVDDMEQLKTRVRRVVASEISLLNDALAACDAVGYGPQRIGRAVRVSVDHMERVREALADLRTFADDM